MSRSQIWRESLSRVSLRIDGRYFVLLIGVVGGIGILDTAILNPIIAAYAESLGADVVLSGLVAGLYSIVAIPASIAMGLSIDVIGRKRALVIGLGLTALWVYGYAWAPTLSLLMAFRVAHAISGSLIFPAGIAMVADTMRRGLGRGIGVYWTPVAAALAIGSAVSAVLVEPIGFRPLIVLVAAISLVGMVIALALPETMKSPMMPRASLKAIASSIRWLSVAYLSYFSLYFAFGVIVGSLSIALISLGLSGEAASRSVGIYLAVAIIVSIPLFYVVGRILRRTGSTKVLSAGLLLTSASQLLLLVSLRPPYSYASAAILGVAIAFVFVASTSLAAIPRARGASVGFHQTANIAGIAVGAPVSGLLLEYFGLAAPFIAAAAVQFVALAVVASSSQVTRLAEAEVLGSPVDGTHVVEE